MATVAITTWTNELRTVLSGCTNDVLEQTIKAVIREFYDKSGLWVETLENLGTTASVSTLDLSAQAVLAGYDARVKSVYHIKYGDVYLRPQHILNTSLTGDIPSEFYGLESGSVRLIPTPSATVANIMEARVVLVPIFTTDVAPIDAKNVWFDEIKDGVLGNLYSQPNKTYTNLVQGQYHLRRFRTGIAEARDVARRRYTQTENSWSFPAWA